MIHRAVRHPTGDAVPQVATRLDNHTYQYKIRLDLYETNSE
jgi:hypothetical protein